MLRSVFGKKLKDQRQRETAIRQAVDQARAAYKTKPLEQAREPILKLRDQFDELGLDRLELLAAAESEFQGDQYWLREIVSILLHKDKVAEQHAPYLLRLVLLEPTNLELWIRLFREARQYESADIYRTAREKCAAALAPFFLPGARNRWSDPITEEEAYGLMTHSLNECVGWVVAEKRTDEPARDLIRSGMRFLTDRPELRLAYAQMIVAGNEPASPENLSVVMEVIAQGDPDIEMKLWVARGLAALPSHVNEGLALLRQLHKENPGNPKFRNALVSALKEQDELVEQDLSIIKRHLLDYPDDLRATEMVADVYVKKERVDEEALEIYRSAAASSPKRRNYLRMIGRVSAMRNEWSEVISIFDEVRKGGQETEDIVIPLATAYAEFDRDDKDAHDIYKKAIEMGSRKLEVHSLYCQHLYRAARSAPESVAQFIQSAKNCPECSWAQLGVISHYLDTGDNGRALDTAIGMLEKAPNDIEAGRLAAKALAADFSRRQLAKLANVGDRALRQIFEEAYRLQPDAGPLALGLARRRVADGVVDEETARLLGEVCRRNPDVVDLRLARADMLWDLGQHVNATELYRELVERWRAHGGHQMPRGISPEARRQMLLRVAEQILRPPGPGQNDIEILVEAIGEKDPPAEIVLGTARALIDLEIDYPQKVHIIERAKAYAPNDLKLERALAELQAANGNPKPAIALAVRLIKQGRVDETTSDLVRSIAALVRGETLTASVLDSLRAAIDPDNHPKPLLLAVSELVVLAGVGGDKDLALLRRVAQHFPRNIRVKRWLAQALSICGEDEEAAGVYTSIVDDGREDDELILELARTNARLGRHHAKQRRIAQRALQLSPDEPDLMLHLACIELERRNISEATRLFDRVLELNPAMHPRVYAVLEHDREVRTEHGELFVVLARVHVKAGRIEQALMVLANLQAEYQRYLGDLIAVYTEIIEADPENPRPLVERAILYRLGGRLEEAVGDMSRAVELSPGNTDILGEYADILRQKLQSGSRMDVDLALKCSGIYIDLGDDLHGYELVEDILERDPGNSGALLLLARLQLHAGALKNCWETLKKVDHSDKKLPILQELARACAEQEDHVMAADVLTAAIEVAGPQRELLEQLRSLYQEQAQSSEGAPQRQRIFGSLSERAQGRYELRDQIGTGAMGVVYKAYDRELDEIVVLKILPEHFAKDPDALARFRNEAKAARKLAHPHICRIHDIGEEDGRRHISMEYVAGGDLRSYLTESGGRLPLGEANRVIRETARALYHAHEEGVLHRDIKAANIMLTPSRRVKLSDFGIAALFEAAGNYDFNHSSPNVIGTPLYMSPEQFDGKNLTPASDIYSLGILYYEILTGAPPFIRGSIPYHHRFTPAPRIQWLPDEVWVVVEKMLRKDPADRYQSPEELLKALDHVPNEMPSDVQDTDDLE